MQHGIIGNCTYSALVNEGSVEWLCWPRMDSSFVFGSLLDEERGGTFSIEVVDQVRTYQEYVQNTNVLRTVFESKSGSFELFDFAPRFLQYERSFKPTLFVRILRPIAGEPIVRIKCRPVYDYGQFEPSEWFGSNHIEFTGLPAPLRLTTNVPLTYVHESRPFVLSRDKHLALSWGRPLESPLEEAVERFLARTIDYWRRWVKHCRIPRDYQEEVIRSALVLKLHQFEDTGAIIASATTSLPEYPGSGRNWDYRYCWLRDTYFSLHAFERLGHFDEMEVFLEYLRNVCVTRGGALQPLYGVNGETDLVEQELPHLAGFKGDGPVRVGNQAYEHVQNDVYGEMILAISRLLIDTRFAGADGVNGAASLVHGLLDQIEERLEQIDAGPWELRSNQRLHSFSLLMHWAGARRAIEIGQALGDQGISLRASRIMEKSREILTTRCWSKRKRALTQAVDVEDLDASMLLAVRFGFWAPGDPSALAHVQAIQRELSLGTLLRRYAVPDDIGEPQAAFAVCSFWLVEALAIVGQQAEARALFDDLIQLHNGLRLFSEDIIPETGEQTGNFPQTYSHVGLIHAAFRLSRPWN